MITDHHHHNQQKKKKINDLKRKIYRGIFALVMLNIHSYFLVQTYSGWILTLAVSALATMIVLLHTLDIVKL